MSDEMLERFHWQPDDVQFDDETATDKLKNVSAKAMSALNSTTGGALVKPPKFMGKIQLKRTNWSRFARPG